MTALSPAMLQVLWRVAQHKYGWTYVYGQKPTVVALLRRGLVHYAPELRVRRRSRQRYGVVVATEDGRAEIKRRWPVSPFVLGTYDHQPGGWTPRDGAGT